MSNELQPYQVSADDLIHVLQGGKLALPSVGIVLEPDVAIWRTANRIRTRVNGGTRVARADGGNGSRIAGEMR